MNATRKPSRRRKAVSIAIACVLLAAVGGTAAVLIAGNTTSSATVHSPMPAPSTVVVKRGDLIESTIRSGTLQYSDTRDLLSGLSGVVTWLPDVGSSIAEGQELYRVSNAPSILLFGPLPAWRSFESGMTRGPDVTQLEQSLARLGLFDSTPDDEFTSKTKRSIQRLQKGLGIEQTGALDFGSVQFAAGPLRIAQRVATVGSSTASGTAILKVSSNALVVALTVPVTEKSVVVPDAKVVVTSPTGAQIPGKVVLVGSTVTEKGSDGVEKTVIPVRIGFDDAKDLASFESSTVTVQFNRVLAPNVLTVPVNALLARPGDAYAVEVYAAGRRRTVAVKVGAFGSGTVQITSASIAPGDKVVVPS